MARLRDSVGMLLILLATAGAIAGIYGVPVPALVGVDVTPSTPTPTATPEPTPTATPTPTPTPTPAPRDPDDPGPSSHSYENGLTLNSSELERIILRETNEERQSRGLEPYKSNAAFASVARAHSEDMYVRDFYAHTNPDGETPYNRYREVGHLDCRSSGENIDTIRTPFVRIWNLNSTEDVARKIVGRWMNSTSHRAAILDDDYTTIGVGAYVGPDRIFATQNFCEGSTPDTPTGTLPFPTPIE